MPPRADVDPHIGAMTLCALDLTMLRWTTGRSDPRMPFAYVADRSRRLMIWGISAESHRQGAMRGV
jgi:hypothetical protein